MGVDLGLEPDDTLQLLPESEPLLSLCPFTLGEMSQLLLIQSPQLPSQPIILLPLPDIEGFGGLPVPPPFLNSQYWKRDASKAGAKVQVSRNFNVSFYS